MLRLLLSVVNRLLLRLVSLSRGPLTWALLKTDDVVEVGYWNIRGLGAPLRMMCEYVGASYTAVTFDVVEKAGGGWNVDAWFVEKKPELLKLNALTNLPYVRIGDQVVTQSNACFTFLGRRFGLMGSTEEEVSKNEQCLAQVHDLRNDAIGLMYGGFGPDKQAIFDGKKDGYLESTAKGHFSKLEKWLVHQGTPFLVGPSPQCADFHLWEMLDQHEALAKYVGKPSLLDGFPKLAAFYQRFRAAAAPSSRGGGDMALMMLPVGGDAGDLPELQGYFNGPLHRLPINNKMAVFGNVALPQPQAAL